MNPLEKIHKDSSYNKEALDEAEQGSCFYCFSKFSSEKILKWCDEGQTAICPNCGIDSVLPGDVASVILDHMYRRWFNPLD